MYSVTTAVKGKLGTAVSKTRHRSYTPEAYSSEKEIKIEQMVLLKIKKWGNK